MKTTDKPTLQEFHISGVRHISPENTLQELESNRVILIDVREEYEYGLDFIPLPNVFNHPLSVILDKLPEIPKEQNIILGCPGGVRSSKVANLLNRQGYPNVANLDGGFNVWKSKGYPYETIFANEACGTDCSSCGESSGSSCC